jgi:hypothetical protein
MPEEKMNEISGEDKSRKGLKVAIIIFSIVELLVVIVGIIYKSHH